LLLVATYRAPGKFREPDADAPEKGAGGIQANAMANAHVRTPNPDAT